MMSTSRRLEEYSIRHSITWIREWWAAGHSGVLLMFRDYGVERMLGEFRMDRACGEPPSALGHVLRTSVDERGRPHARSTPPRRDARPYLLNSMGCPQALPPAL